MTAWHQLTATEALEQLDSEIEAGLSTSEISKRQEQYGSNQLVEMGGRGPWLILWEQLSSAMIVLLLVAALVSLYLEEYIDSGAIFAIIALNAALGFFQDYRAEKALAALKQLAVPTVKVHREGVLREIASLELVPGDIVILEAGNLVPADCRLIECANLRIEEASLTGESEAVEKQTDALDVVEPPLGDRTNLAFMGTMVTYGHGMAVVTAIGMSTELGKIARSLQTVKPQPTPLQSRLAQFGRTLALAALGIVAIVFCVGIVLGEDPKLMVMTSLSLAVAVVPEGLPAVATVALAMGARRMFRRHALIRKLPAVETLGSVTVICSDKTGTITENRMTVTVLDVANRQVDLTKHDNRETGGEEPTHETSLLDESSVVLLLAGASLCNDAELVTETDAQSFEALGEPTEAALIVVAAQLGLVESELAKQFPRIDEVPFDSQRKRMTTLHRIPISAEKADGQANGERIVTVLGGIGASGEVAFMKGAVDAVLETCRFVWEADEVRELDADLRNRIQQAHDQLAGSGMRVLGVAFRPLETAPPRGQCAGIEQEMIFVGMLGMIDPPRSEVTDAVARCRAAGIRPIMITGDHPLTAQYIARQTGISDHDRTLEGREMVDKTAEDLQPLTEEISVYARVAPQDKLHIVQALQNNGHVVAMTGDGVNDAPALKQAHIGVAMGQIGTDVSKEAADMVLLDDNFASIVNAVEEGRIVYDNIRKFVLYTMTSNAGEVWVMLLGPLLGMPLPLLPLQILWVNLVTDGLPGLALAVEGAENATMQRPPYPPSEHIVGRSMWGDIAWVGLLMGAVSLAMGYVYWNIDASEDHWRTIVFTVLTISQMGNAMAVRSSRDSLFQIGVFSNRAMIGSVALTFGLQMAVIYLPPLQSVFHTVPLSLGELLACLLLSSIVFWAVEAKKLWLRS